MSRCKIAVLKGPNTMSEFYALIVFGHTVYEPLLFLPHSSLNRLQCNWENREHLKYLRNVYCVMSNRSKSHNTRTGHKTTNYSVILVIVDTTAAPVILSVNSILAGCVAL